MDILQSINNTMSEKNSVSFKVSLVSNVSDSRKVEVRRFVVDQSASTSLTFLKEKLVSLFPAELRRADAKVSWRDEDGDDVTISSDEELIIALTEMKGPVYKLEVCVAATPKVVINDADKANNGNALGEVHQGVSCDGCNQAVVGFRYKCVICPDYDLCGKCETMGTHPGHNMIRIATPETLWPKHFFNRLNRLQTKASKVASGEAEWTRRGCGASKTAKEADAAAAAASGDEPNDQPQPAGPCGPGFHGRGARRGHAGPFMGFRQCGVQGPWGRAMGQLGPHFEAHAKAQAEANPKSTAEEGDASEATKYSHEVLSNLGQIITAALDPFLHADFESPEGRKNDGQNKDDAKKPDEAQEPEKPKAPKEATPEHGDGEWTVLDDKSASPEPLKEDIEASTDGTMYPKLTSTETQVKQPMRSEVFTATHPNPKIQVALQAMMNMGFTNEGGWLVQLLETKDGDIGKVLDILQPIRPTRA
jgi:sequestosome 1